jgi:hypothetical protein
MGLENITGPGVYINALNPNWPIGGSDDIAEGDTHLRGIKNTLINTFPNIAGAVLPTHSEINYLSGVTANVQAQLNEKAALAHSHSEYAAVSHSHSGYALASHAHTDYESRISTLEGLIGSGGYTPEQSLVAANVGLDGKVTVNTSVPYTVFGYEIRNAEPNALVTANSAVTGSINVGYTNAQGHYTGMATGELFSGQAPGDYTFTYYVNGNHVGQIIYRVI